MDSTQSRVPLRIHLSQERLERVEDQGNEEEGVARQPAHCTSTCKADIHFTQTALVTAAGVWSLSLRNQHLQGHHPHRITYEQLMQQKDTPGHDRLRFVSQTYWLQMIRK